MISNLRYLNIFGKKLVLLAFALSLIHCKSPETPPTGLVTEHAMVVSAREEASRIGAEIIKKGGNAFDAMIATEMALAVVYPFAGNLGGGGFMVYRLKDGSIGSLDFREKAPLAASKNMYLDSLGNALSDLSRKGATASGVPGTIAGIFEVHKKFGSLPMEELLAPVIELAESGFTVTENQAKRLAGVREEMIYVNGDSVLFSQVHEQGTILKNQALANTLRRISSKGRDEFYKGETGKILVDFIQERGGYISMEDLNRYEAIWREPVVFDYKDLKIISMAPPSSGGITMHQIFKMIEPYDLQKMGLHSLPTIHLFTEAAKRAYADRNYYLGDPDFVSIPTETLLSEVYLKERMSNFSFDKATPSSKLGEGYISGYESQETTHYSIVDDEGNAVSVTTTLNGAYGSKLYISELGFFMNNEMDDFSIKPGEPNMFGLIGAEANSIQPEKRMLSSMTPTIVERNGKLWMVVGTPGGSTIITAVAQTILNAYEFKLSMQEAVDAPRFHHQWLPDMLIFEPEGFDKDLKDSLRFKGHPINEGLTPIIGKVDAIRILSNGSLEAGADKRGDDRGVGF